MCIVYIFRHWHKIFAKLQQTRHLTPVSNLKMWSLENEVPRRTPKLLWAMAKKNLLPSIFDVWIWRPCLIRLGLSHWVQFTLKSSSSIFVHVTASTIMSYSGRAIICAHLVSEWESVTSDGLIDGKIHLINVRISAPVYYVGLAKTSPPKIWKHFLQLAAVWVSGKGNDSLTCCASHY